MLMQIVNILFSDLYLVFSVIIALMTEFIKPKNQVSLLNALLLCIARHLKNQVSAVTTCGL